MNKTELVAQVAATTNLRKDDVNAVLQAFENTVRDQLAKGKEVALSGFGTFRVVQVAERQGRNPKTGETLLIAAHKSPKFKPGKAFKDAVNG